MLKAAGIEPHRITPVAPRLLPTLLRMPTPVFRVLASRMLRIDAQARSSMADDLRLGRVTEIDALCGEVCRLAEAQAARRRPTHAWSSWSAAIARRPDRNAARHCAARSASDQPTTRRTAARCGSGSESKRSKPV